MNFHRALLNFRIVVNLGKKKFTLFAFGFHTVLNSEVLLGFELLQRFSLINYEWRRRVPFVVIKNGEPIWMIRGTNLSLKVLNNYVDGEFPFSREISKLTQRYYYYVIPRTLLEEEINSS